MSNKVGQLVFTGVSGTALLDDEKKFLEQENIGGVILFGKNYESPGQLAELVNEIQKCREEYPLFIAVDQEGGRVTRFKSEFTVFPSMSELAKLDSPKLVFHAAKIMAEELSACGINLNLSPVCDVLSNPGNTVIGERSFGNSGEEVAKYVSSIIRGLQTNGMLSCAKHFPGHGSTTKDSHFDLPFVQRTLEEFRNSDLLPFEKAVKSRVEFIMMAHLKVDWLDEEFPTSLSSKAYKFLREELRYKKIIITDDMQMGALEKYYPTEDAAVKALQAGADVLEYRDMEFAAKAINAIKLAAKEKTLPNEIIAEKIDRIKECKKTFLSEYKPIYLPEITKTFNQNSSQVFLKDLNEKLAEVNQ